MVASDARTQQVERLAAEIAALPLMGEAVFHSVRFLDGRIEKEVCDVLILHDGEAIVVSVKAQGRRRDLSETKRWAEKQAPKALAQLKGAYRTLKERQTWCQHTTFEQRTFAPASIVPIHGICLIESEFEASLAIDELSTGDTSRVARTSLMSITDFDHIVRYLRTWRDLVRYLESRHLCLRFPDSATLGAEVALLGYYTAMRDTFRGCLGIADAKILAARGEHVQHGAAFRGREALFSRPLEDVMRKMSVAVDLSLPADLEHLQSSFATDLLQRDAVREHLCGLTIQERAAIGEQICLLCARMLEEQPSEPLYGGVRFNQHPDEVYVVVVGMEWDHAALSVSAIDLTIAACVYHGRSKGTAILLNQPGSQVQFTVCRIENVEPTVEMMAAGEEYFGHVGVRKVQRARWSPEAATEEHAPMLFRVTRPEIERVDVRRFARWIDHLSMTRETTTAARNGVDFLVDGYNEDPRDLFEVATVRRWVQTAAQTVATLAYFLNMGEQAQGIQTIVYCLCETKRIKGTLIYLKQAPGLLAFMRLQFHGLNELTERFALGEDVNREVSLRFSGRIRRMLKGGDALSLAEAGIGGGLVKP